MVQSREVKRGRGRPKKDIVPVTTTAAVKPANVRNAKRQLPEVEDVDVPKRKRGRPRKEPTLEVKPVKQARKRTNGKLKEAAKSLSDCPKCLIVMSGATPRPNAVDYMGPSELLTTDLDGIYRTSTSLNDEDSVATICLALDEEEVPKSCGKVVEVNMDKILDEDEDSDNYENEDEQGESLDTSIVNNEKEVPTGPAPITAYQESIVPTPAPQVTDIPSRPDFKLISDCKLRCDADYVLFNDKPNRCHCQYTEEEKKEGKACASDSCLNRAMRYECPQRCTSGEYCRNRRFQNREYPKLEPFFAGAKGWGIRALEPIPSGSFIIEYVGEVIDFVQCRRRCRKYAKDPKHKHHYLMSLTAETLIDATRKGNISRFINHSCDPNAATEKWTINRRNRIGFFAVKDIAANEEIVFDYNFERFGKEAQKCYCGSQNCRGYISGKQQPVEESQDITETEDESEDEESSAESSDEDEDDEEEDEPIQTPPSSLPNKVVSVVTRARLAERKANAQERRIMAQFQAWADDGQIHRNLDHFKRRLTELNWPGSAKRCIQIIHDFDDPTMKTFSERSAMDAIWYLGTTFFENRITSAQFDVLVMVVNILLRVTLKSQQQVKPCVHKLMTEFTRAVDRCCSGVKDNAADDEDLSDVLSNMITKIENYDFDVLEQAVDIKYKIYRLYEQWSELPEMEFRIPKKIVPKKPEPVSRWEPARPDEPDSTNHEPFFLGGEARPMILKKEGKDSEVVVKEEEMRPSVVVNVPMSSQTTMLHMTSVPDSVYSAITTADPYMYSMYPAPYAFMSSMGNMAAMSPQVPQFLPPLPPIGLPPHPAFIPPLPPAQPDVCTRTTAAQAIIVPAVAASAPSTSSVAAALQQHAMPAAKASTSAAERSTPPTSSQQAAPAAEPLAHTDDETVLQVQRLVTSHLAPDKASILLAELLRDFNVARKPVPAPPPARKYSRNCGEADWSVPSAEKMDQFRLQKPQLSELKLTDQAARSAKRNQPIRIPVPPLPPSAVDSTSVLAYTASLKVYRNLLDRHIESVAKSLM